MWPFSRKVKRDAVEFCQEFYDRSVLGPNPNGAKMASVAAIATQRTISEIDESFLDVSLPKLTDELLALRLEMIETAWTHATNKDAAFAISEYTKQHLNNIGRLDLWEVMLAYNHTVAQSAVDGYERITGSGRSATINYFNKMRANLADEWCDKWLAKGRDLEPAGRVINRFGSAEHWSFKAKSLVAAQLTSRLGFEGSDEAKEILTAVCHGFYQGAKEALKCVTLTTPTWQPNHSMTDLVSRECHFAA